MSRFIVGVAVVALARCGGSQDSATDTSTMGTGTTTTSGTTATGATTTSGGTSAGTTTGTTMTDVCEPNPCLNGGVCSDVGGVPECDCTDTGYTGDLCETALIAPVSVNFDDTATLAAADIAGQVQTTNWNNALGAGVGQGDEGALADLADEDAAATGISLSWSCQDIEVTPITGGTAGDQAMMGMGCRSWMGMGDATVTVSGINAHFTTPYTLVVYVGQGGGFPADHTANFTLGVGTTNVDGQVLAGFDGTWDDLAGSGDPGNIYTSAGHTENELVLTMAATGNAQLPTAAINGIQLIAEQ